MLEALARSVVRRPVVVLVTFLLLVVLAGAYGGGVAGVLSGGGFDDPRAESSRAAAALEERFAAGEPNVVLVVTAPGPVDDPATVTAGRALTDRLAAEPGLAEVTSYWSAGAPPPLRSDDGRKALVLGRILGDDDAVGDRITELAPRYAGSSDGLTVAVGGSAEVFRQISTQIQDDLAKAEVVAVPITLIVLVLVFGSLVAALLPLVVGVVAVIGTFFVLRALTEVTDVSIFALNLTTALGLGLAIDYALFMVSRYREELAAGQPPGEAVVTTVRTAGRTVVFSALTVALSLAALVVFPLYFLRSFAYAGIAVVLLGAAAAVVVLPALLVLLGRRVDSLDLRRGVRRALRRPEPEAVSLESSFWYRLAKRVMRRPVPVATGVLAVLLLLGAPFLSVSFGLADDRSLPRSAPAQQASEVLRSEFSARESAALSVLAVDRVDPAARAAYVSGYAGVLSGIEGVARVDAATGSYAEGRQVAPAGPGSARYTAADGTWLSVVPSVEPFSDAGRQLVRDLRAAPAPFAVAVTGPSANLLDTERSLAGRAPYALLLVAVATLVVLFLLTGSVVLPIKALVLNVLSLSATFGAMVWIFQQGHLSGLLGDFIVTGTIDTTTPILMFCIAFGLSMDYEVFLLSRIREEYLRTGDNVGAVAAGLGRTGRIVTAAAVLISIIFLAFATSSITFIKLMGIGLALAVIMDATVVRGLLVPALMRLAGQWNWWAPRPLRRLHDRFGLNEGDGRALPAPGPVAEPAGLVSTGSGRR